MSLERRQVREERGGEEEESNLVEEASKLYRWAGYWISISTYLHLHGEAWLSNLKLEIKQLPASVRLINRANSNWKCSFSSRVQFFISQVSKKGQILKFNHPICDLNWLPPCFWPDLTCSSPPLLLSVHAWSVRSAWTISASIHRFSPKHRKNTASTWEACQRTRNKNCDFSERIFPPGLDTWIRICLSNTAKGKFIWHLEIRKQWKHALPI